MVEQVTLNHWVRGSNPRAPTTCEMRRKQRFSSAFLLTSYCSQSIFDGDRSLFKKSEPETTTKNTEQRRKASAIPVKSATQLWTGFRTRWIRKIFSFFGLQVLWFLGFRLSITACRRLHSIASGNLPPVLRLVIL